MQLAIASSLPRLQTARPLLANEESAQQSCVTDGYQASQANALELIRPNLAEPSTKTELRQTSPIVANSLALAGEIAAQSVPGAGALSAVDSKEILGLFDRWNDALQTGDPNQVAREYAPDAILLPTVSNRVRHTSDEIKDYFVHFLAKKPKGKIDEANIRQFGDVAINSGLYTFSFAGAEDVSARYTFVYRKVEGEWKIAEHHSSVLPEASALDW